MDNVTTIVRAADVELLLKLFDAKGLTPDQWRAYCRMLGSVAASREQDDLDNGGKTKKFQLMNSSGMTNKVLFIKFLRELFGYGLKEAKDLADQILSGGGSLEIPADMADKFHALNKISQGGYADYAHLQFVEVP